jgi:hypothetical protein
MIKKLLLSHQDPGVVQIYECQNSDDFLGLAEQFPLETTSLANRSGGTIVGYYMIGIGLPTKADTFTRPILVYYYLNDADWRIWHTEIKEEALRRKKVYMENKNSFRDIKNSR